MSDSVRPHRRQPTRLPCPWDSPGKNTGVGCHFLLQCMKGKSESEVSQLCRTLRDPMDCSLPGSSIHGIFQVRVLEWGAIAFSITANGLGSIPGWGTNIPQATRYSPPTQKTKNNVLKKKMPQVFKFKHLGCLLATLVLSCMNRNLNKIKSLSSRSLRAKGRKWNS